MMRRKRSRGRFAWGDESIRTQDAGPGRYMVGVTLCDTDEESIRAGFRTQGLLEGRKVHWYDMDRRQQRKSIDYINTLGLRHVVISAEPLPNTIRPERARRKCLETLLPILENQYGVTQLFMESRNTKQDEREIQFIQAMRLRGFIDGLEYNLYPGGSDARLWIPDQILGVVGADDWHGPDLNDYETYTIRID